MERVRDVTGELEVAERELEEVGLIPAEDAVDLQIEPAKVLTKSQESRRPWFRPQAASKQTSTPVPLLWFGGSVGFPGSWKGFGGHGVISVSDRANPTSHIRPATFRVQPHRLGASLLTIAVQPGASLLTIALPLDASLLTIALQLGAPS